MSGEQAVVTRFDRDTAIESRGDGRHAARIDPGWFIVKGPNGGYVAAIVLRALQAAVADPARAPRSLTVHYTAPPGEGPVELETRIERTGRSLTTASARLLQDGRLMALALGAFSLPRDARSFDHTQMPEAPPAESLARSPARHPMGQRYDCRYLPGAGSEVADAPRPLTMGWIRLEQARAVDAPLLAAYTDAFIPPSLAWCEGGPALGPLPTIDLTVHFRAPLPRRECGPGDFCLGLFRSRLARAGFVEEDGELWSRDGLLLAQSRQLAVVLG